MILIEIYEIIKTKNDSIEYLIEKNVVKNYKNCYKCRKELILDKLKEIYIHKDLKKCSHSVSMWKNTIFENSKIGINNVMLIAYLYFKKVPITSIEKMTGHSSKTICAWTKFIRNHCADSVNYNDVVIGGKDVIVEIDETKLGKRKYNKGHSVDGVWVLAGIERTKEKNIFSRIT